MRLPRSVCLSNQLEFYEIQLGRYTIERSVNAVIFNTVFSNNPKTVDIQTSEVDAKLALVNVVPRNVVCS
jgi:hypothetical protein